jgi:hypothetical protein
MIKGPVEEHAENAERVKGRGGEVNKESKAIS